jgi:hypothetical protein
MWSYGELPIPRPPLIYLSYKMKIRISLLFIFLIPILIGIGFSQPQFITRGNVGQPLYTFTVTGSGIGTGTITSDVYGINCTSTAGVESGACSVTIPMGTTVTLTATPDGSSVFAGWTGSGCVGVGTCSILIDGSKSVNAEFVVMPSGGLLTAWYRLNEGSGSTVYNYAPASAQKLPDLPVINFGNFWTLRPGFGSANSANKNYCRWINAASVLTTSTIGYRGSFIFITGADFPYPTIFNHNNSTADTAGASNYISYDTGILNISIQFNGTSSVLVLSAPQNGHWWFIFNARSGTKFRTYAVKDTGVLITGGETGTWTDQQIKQVRFFRYYDSANTRYNHFYGSAGDTFQYRGVTLFLSDWRIIYETFRSRYGMAAPSGW